MPRWACRQWVALFAALAPVASACGGDDTPVQATAMADATGADAQAGDTAVGVAGGDAASPQCKVAADCPGTGPCLLPACSPTGTCLSVVKADGAPCEDGNACTTLDTCTQGQCAGGGPLGCDDLNPCTVDACDGGKGCAHLPAAASTACDDGDACTLGDACQAGACVPGLSVCACSNHADCGKFDDGNACNGTQYCDKSQGVPYTCKLNPATVVVCPATADGPCQKSVCLPLTGQCALQVAPTSTACDDGDPCTVGDYCDKGLCLGGTATCACKSDADCAPLEDGNLCNGKLFCNMAMQTCQLNPLTVVQCQTVDNSYCATAQCNPKTGKCLLVPEHQGLACDDGNPCTPNETCVGAQCASGINACACQTDADCAAKDDGNACNGTLYCDAVTKTCVVNPATVTHCDTSDDGPCAVDTCDTKTGKCAPLALPKDGSPCDDANACTSGSTCSAGKCTGGVSICQCQNDADCAAHEDGNLCNGTLYCDKLTNACVVNPATVVACGAAFDETCSANVCNPKTGQCAMTPVNQGNPCSTGALCKKGGWCDLGKCGGEVVVCACTSSADCQDDGDLCNGTPYCDSGANPPVCKINPKTVKVCSSVGDPPCIQHVCEPQSGLCVPKPKGQIPCEDGDPCTSGDLCVSGACVSGSNLCACTKDADCAAKEDGNLCNGTLYCDTAQVPFGCKINPATVVLCPKPGDACTASQCAAKTGVCSVTALVDGQPCSDGSPCTVSDVCAGGFCQGKVLGCDDNNPCTIDSCLPSAGCQHVTLACADNNPCTVDGCNAATGKCKFDGLPLQGAACNADGDGCTAGDSCAGGKCVPGKAVTCPNANPCAWSQCVSTGNATYQCQDAVKPDGEICDAGPGCVAKATCVKGACSGPAKPILFDEPMKIDDFKPAPSWGQWQQLAALPDGGAAVAGTVVVSGEVSATVWGIVQRRSATGTLLWSKSISTLHPDPAVGYAGGLVVLPDGSLALAMNGAFMGAASTQVVALSPDGAQKWSTTCLYSYNLRTMVALKDGSLLVVSSTMAGPAVRLGADGQLLWTATMPANHSALGATALADGGALIVGEDSTSGLGHGWVTKIDAAGKWKWSRSYGFGAAERLVAATEQADGHLLAVGTWTDTATLPHLWWTELDANGYLVADRHTALDRSPSSLARAAGLIVLAGQTKIASGQPEPWLAAFDLHGVSQWEKGFAGGVGFTSAVAAGPDQRLWAAMVRDKGAKGNLVHTDTWGHVDCAESGVCAGLTATDCDDGQACTRDACAATQGCSHATADGEPCADSPPCYGPGTCSGKATCASDAKPVVGGAGLGDDKLWAAETAGVDSAGNILVVGRTGIAGQPANDLRAVGLLPTAQKLAAGNWNWALPALGAGSQAATLVNPMADGSWFAFFDSSYGTGPGGSLCYELSITGSLVLQSGVNLSPWAECTFRDAAPVIGSAGLHAVVMAESSLPETPVGTIALQTAGPGLAVAPAPILDCVVANLPCKWTQVHVGAIGAQRWLAATLQTDPPKGHVLRAYADGTKVTETTLTGPAASTMILNAVTPLPQGALVAGQSGPAGALQATVVRLDVNAKVLWTSTLGLATPSAVQVVQVLANQQILAAGTQAVGGFSQVFWARLDLSGAVLAKHVVGAPGESLSLVSRGGLSVRDDGVLVLVGNVTANGLTAPWLYRTDPWGLPTCGTSGACFGTSSCDDGLSCTLDLCEAATGCKHLPTSGAPCDDGDPVTQADLCSKGACLGQKP